MRSLLSALGLALLASCGAPQFGVGAPKTTLVPPPGPFNDQVTVTFKTDVAAKVYVTTDGSDPRDPKGTRVSGASPFQVTLTKSTTVGYYASNGSDEIPHSVQYVRAGGKVGTISGVIVVDSVALGKPIVLDVDGNQQPFAAVSQRTEIPFTVSGLGTGRHTLQAIADRDGDGRFIPFLDLSSDAPTFDLDLGDPFKASVENVKLFLGASDDGLCSIVGTVTVPNAQPGEVVRMSVLNPSAFSGSADPTALLQQLQSGDQLLLSPDQEAYPYAITNLQPGAYLPVPALTSFGVGGFGLDFMGNPLDVARCNPGQILQRNFSFGPLSLSGTVTVPTPAGSGTAGLGNFSYGLVAARHLSFTDGIQAVLMPVVFLPDAQDGTKLTGNYTGHGYRAGSEYYVRVFASGGSQNPIVDALTWVLDPLATDAPDAIVDLGQTDVTRDIDLTTP